jgi:branched-chain amino acid aminotransferase
MAARHARENGLDDMLLVNTDDRICESAIANVFMVKDGRIITPPLEEGCVDGVMRRFMLEHLPSIGYEVKQEPLPMSRLLTVDEIFLTNALHLLRPVKRCEDLEYGSRHSAIIYKAMGEKWPHAAQLSD